MTHNSGLKVSAGCGGPAWTMKVIIEMVRVQFVGGLEFEKLALHMTARFKLFAPQVSIRRVVIVRDMKILNAQLSLPRESSTGSFLPSINLPWHQRQPRHYYAIASKALRAGSLGRLEV